MAMMIPKTPMDEEFHHSAGEKKLFRALAELPSDFVVFYSVFWNCRDEKGHLKWGEADYTVFHKKRGLLTIEVKDGAISCDSNGIILQTNRATGEQKRIQPMEQASRSKYTFVDLLSESKERFWVEPVVWFTSVRRGSVTGRLPVAYHEENVLYEQDIDSPFKALMRAYDFYDMQERRHSEEAVNEVINTLAPCFQAFPSLSSIYGDQEFYFNRMTQEQSFLLDYLEEQKTAVIQGAAGTGKTVLAVEKARRLSRSEKVLFLCYNRNLYQDLRKKWSRQMPNVDFYNLQAIASLALNRKATMDDVSDFLLDYQSFFGGWKYQSIIVDEGQDFLSAHISLLRVIAETAGGSFYVFYDKHQLVQQPLWSAGEKDDAADEDPLSWVDDFDCRLVLNMNCRNTRSIAETAGIPVNVTNIRMRQEIVGEKPKFHILRTAEEARESIGSIIKSYTAEGIKREQIVILTVKNTTNSILAGCTSVSGYRLRTDKDEEKKDGILFTTTKRFKGLEADVVIIIDITEDSFDTFESRNLYYVGASRAKHFLELVAVLNEKQEKRLAEALDQKGKNARMALVTGLKVKVQSH